ncbi:MAG: transporter substrate-binding domain-containing protein [Anaerolineae bacterium]|nr:transporter substrate-binding domain-containing protein [Anaerolineae bacterium]
MYKKPIILILTLLFFALALAACGGGETQTVEVTREVEVTRIVEVEVAGEAAAAGDPVAVTFAEAGDTLKQVQDRGTLKCGGNQNVPGFGYLDPDSGDFTGFDIDFCKAIAAAALGDAAAHEVTPTTGDSRFPTLQSGEVDVLIRNTTWTFSRDTALRF